jgi:hypothetical protein
MQPLDPLSQKLREWRQRLGVVEEAGRAVGEAHPLALQGLDHQQAYRRIPDF